MAEAFVAAGMNVVIADLRRDHIETALQRRRERGAEARARDRAGRHRPRGLRPAADEAETLFGNVHVLCNNAGMGILGPVTPRATTTGTGASACCSAASSTGSRRSSRDPRTRRGRAHRQHLVDGRRGPDRGRAIYITAKAALIGFSEALRSELAEAGIGVSAFCPGAVQTNIREGGRTRPERYGDSGYAVLERELQAPPSHRSGWTRARAASGCSRASASTTCTSSRTASSGRAPMSASAPCSPRPRTSRGTRSGGRHRVSPLQLYLPSCPRASSS